MYFYKVHFRILEMIFAAEANKAKNFEKQSF